jgi:hypothetical protein
MSLESRLESLKTRHAGLSVLLQAFNQRTGLPVATPRDELD